MSEVLDEDLAYCAGQIQQGDPDRFACAMLAPMPLRRYLVALYAFNLEIAKIRETVSEPMLGEIRLQWWRDVIGECVAGQARRHQVAQPLTAAIQATGVSADLFLDAISARARDFDQIAPQDEAAVKGYVDQTGGAVGEIAMALSGSDANEALAAGRAAGRAWAWIGLARGLHVHRRLGRLTIPVNRLSAAPSLDDDVERAIASVAVREWTEWLVVQARQDIATVSGVTTKEMRPVLAPARLAALYAARLTDAGFDPFQVHRNTLGPARRSLALLRLSLIG